MHPRLHLDENAPRFVSDGSRTDSGCPDPKVSTNFCYLGESDGHAWRVSVVNLLSGTGGRRERAVSDCLHCWPGGLSVEMKSIALC